ncbi:MAG TPA: HAD-IA family hydrolase [Candidatus Saccharimonadales bacterium]|nr:HAD-IA family hydrolase [Candidatus Saccharimonadales bacterium]
MTLESLEKYDVLLFDWDGTLADSTPLWTDTMGLVLGEFTSSMPSSNDMLHAMGDWHWFVHNGYFASEKLTAYAERVHMLMAERRRETPLEDGARQALGRIALPGKKLGIVTAGARPHIDEMLEIHELTDAFDVVISSDDTKAHKPDPEGINLALTALGVKDRSTAVMFGDNSRDLMAAHNAGIDSVLYLPPGAHFTQQEIADKCAQGCEPVAIIRSWHEFALPNAA